MVFPMEFQERPARRQLWPLLVCAVLVAAGRPASAEEPYEKFLQQHIFDPLQMMALAYIDQLGNSRSVTPQFRAAIDLERGLLQYQSAALLPPSNPLRSTQLDQAEQTLRNFLDQRRNHPRRGEARLKIAELLMQRAEEALSRDDHDPTKNNDVAIGFYNDAHELFENTIRELAGIIENIKGARTDPNNPQAVAYRTRVQQNYRQAQLLSASSMEQRGRSKADGSPGQKADLETAQQMFSDLYSKAQNGAVKNYALFYRSNIQSTLGRTADAIDGFQRIADIEADALRPLQMKAVKNLLDLLTRTKKFPAAVDRGDWWVQSLRPDEVETVDAIDLKMALAKTKIAWSEALRAQNPDDRVASRLVRDTRSDLRSLLRVGGSHQDETRELLAKIGVGPIDSNEPTDELPDVSSFDEAIAEARKRSGQAETDSLEIAILEQQGKDDEARAAEASVSRLRGQAIELLRTALRLYSGEDDLSTLERARFDLAYLNLKEDRPWEALAISEMVARKNPRSDQGLLAAAVALGAFSDLLRTSGADQKLGLTNHLEPFARYLVATWPDSQEAAAAASALVQLALANQQWDKVDDYLSLAPKSGDAAARLRRDVGLTFFNRYVEQKRKAGESDTETVRLKKQALDSLQVAAAAFDARAADDAALDAVNAFTRLLIADNQLDAATKVFLESASPLKVVEQTQAGISEKVAMNSYRTAIQLSVSRLANGQLQPAAAIEETKAYIDALQKLAGDNPQNQATLISIFVALARDLKSQLSDADNDQQRKRLSEAMILLAKEAAKSNAFNTKYWAADTIISTAEELEGGRKGDAVAPNAYAAASQILKAILDRNKNQPGYITPESTLIQVRLLAAKAAKGNGDFKTAINTFEEILTDKPGLLSVQIEAARTYQAWGEAQDLRFYGLACEGHRRDPKTRQNRIWGWGKIAQVVQGKHEYDEQFFVARYELARSRFRQAESMADPQSREKTLRAAEKRITETATLYPDLGGALMKQRYDNLMKAVQKALNKPQDGLAGI